MRKKFIRPMLAIFLVLFSFYYTNKSIDIVRNIDPIMKQIESNREKFETKSTNALIINNTIVPGIKGKKVDKYVSYNKMKKYGVYNESLTTIKEVRPTVSVNDYYDKYVVQGNEKIKQVSLLYKIDSLESLNLITNYLTMEHIPATLFIEDSILDEVKDKLPELNNYEIELLFSNDREIDVSTSSNYLDSITGRPNKYCYTEEENDKLLNICRKYKMHTIIPTFILNKNPTKVVKEKIKNGSIIGVDLTNQVEKELDYIVYYIKSKGYSMVRLDTLLKE